jgi:hypothetical protein
LVKEPKCEKEPENKLEKLGDEIYILKNENIDLESKLIVKDD